MTHGERLLGEHVQRFNAGLRSGDFAPMVAAFAEHARMEFVGAPAGPFVGRDAIEAAYREQPPDDEIVLADDRPVLDLALGREQDEAVSVRARAEHEQLVGVDDADDLAADELLGGRARDRDRPLATAAGAEVDGDEQRRPPRARLLARVDDAADGELELLEALGDAHGV